MRYILQLYGACIIFAACTMGATPSAQSVSNGWKFEVTMESKVNRAGNDPRIRIETRNVSRVSRSLQEPANALAGMVFTIRRDGVVLPISEELTLRYVATGNWGPVNLLPGHASKRVVDLGYLADCTIPGNYTVEVGRNVRAIAKDGKHAPEVGADNLSSTVAFTVLPELDPIEHSSIHRDWKMSGALSAAIIEQGGTLEVNGRLAWMGKGRRGIKVSQNFFGSYAMRVYYKDELLPPIPNELKAALSRQNGTTRMYVFDGKSEYRQTTRLDNIYDLRVPGNYSVTLRCKNPIMNGKQSSREADWKVIIGFKVVPKKL